MEVLTKRGKCLSNTLKHGGFEVIEVHPFRSGKILFGTDSKKEWLSALSNRGYNITSELNEYEIDSVMAALTGKLYLSGDIERLGDEMNKIVIPHSHLIDF